MEKIFLILSFMAMAFDANAAKSQLTNLKVDAFWKIKYDAKEWNYLYFTPSKSLSSNIFIHNKYKFKMFLQRESHIEETGDLKKSLEKNCKSADDFYGRKNMGKASLEMINKQFVCYVEIKSADGKSMTRQFLYPDWTAYKKGNKGYDLLSYGWKSNDPKSKDAVVNFLKGFIE